MAGKLMKYQELRRVFMPGGNLPAGDLTSLANFRQPDLADVLETIGRDGPEAFYTGDIASALVSDIQEQRWNPIRARPCRVRPLRMGRRFGVFLLRSHCPSSAVRLRRHHLCYDPALGRCCRRPLALPHNSVEALHKYIWAARLAYADRFQFMSDPAFVDVPWEGLVSESYTRLRQESISTDKLGRVVHGDPWAYEDGGPKDVLEASAPALDSGTTHLCTMDADGNAVSLTNTIMAGLGSGIVPKGTGVVMNNGMMWFDPVPGRVNSIMPGKYPLNNMTPALALDSDGPRLAVGASGGRRITNCVTQLIMKVLDHGMGPQEAIDSPRVDCSLPVTSVDPRVPDDVLDRLRSRGHEHLRHWRQPGPGRIRELRKPGGNPTRTRYWLPRWGGHVSLGLCSGGVILTAGLASRSARRQTPLSHTRNQLY